MEDYFVGSSFENLQTLTDCILYTEDGCKFKAHKVIMAHSSKYFEKLFCNEFFTPPIVTVVPVIKSTIFNKLLCYIYQKVNILMHDTIADVLLAADFLIMDNLFNDCKGYLLSSEGITVENCLPVYNACWSIELKEIAQICLRFIELHFEEVFEDAREAICDLHLEVLKLILDSDNLNVSEESMVWDTVVTWISKDISERGLYFFDLLKYIRLQDIHCRCINKLQMLPVNNTNPFFDLSDKISATQIVTTTKLLRQAKTLPQSLTGLRPSRSPNVVHFICKETLPRKADLYLSYDDKLDYWNSIGEYHYRLFLDVFVAGRLIFLLSLNQPNMLSAFNFIDETWIDIRPVPQRRRSYSLVSVRDVLYAVGGIVSTFQRDDYEDFVLLEFFENYEQELQQVNIHFNSSNSSDEESVSFENTSAQESEMVQEEYENEDGNSSVAGGNEQEDINDESSNEDLYTDGRTTVQFYDEQSNTWREVKSMYPAHIVRVVSFNDNIYVIGESYTYDRMVCQFYDPLEDKWTLIPSPEVHRTDCIAVGYNGSLYLIGGQDRHFFGIKKVEEYNPIRNSWSALPDLPFKYLELKVFVFNNTLIVFEKSSIFRVTNPAIHWNFVENKWELVDNIYRELLSEIGNCHMITIQNPNIIIELIKSRKQRGKNWTKSSLIALTKEDFPRYNRNKTQ